MSLTKMGGLPVNEALQAVQASFCSIFHRISPEIYQEARYLLRAPAGTETEFVFTKSDGKQKTVKITSAAELASYAVTSIYSAVLIQTPCPSNSRSSIPASVM